LLGEQRTAHDYLSEICTGGTERRWPAAYELSRLMSDPKVRSDRSLGSALVQAFDATKEDDPRVRRYLALAIGRLDPPLPPEAVPSSKKAPHEPNREVRISVIWALGSSADAAIASRLDPLYQSSDAGIRKMVVYALGALPGASQVDTLRVALQDSAA